ncbi:hypothetical protein R1917_13700 [Citrobacter koseri]|uniref:tail fiber/spike domain-containing protein n=1 Tax=Citrobacter koseri TaxID=545 RepID=UPI002942FEB6|nr:hypothetical protein [Citrobacter koseri]WOJ29006.1 hypothetical protein R1917_13700 [Citrobacter koseri]WOJ37498.1 hypothetical protein R1243_11245 [Citrobacter koseri]
MTTYNTGNPLGSAAAKDLYDNAQNFDHLSNDRVNETWDDRFGVPRLTWHGMEQRYKTALVNLGLNPVGTFQGGAVINSAGDIIQDETTGAWYRWDDLATLPKTVPSGSTPDSSGGTGVGKWLAVDVSDVLRGDLAKQTGAGLVGASSVVGEAVTLETYVAKINKAVYLTELAPLITGTDWTAAFQFVNDNSSITCLIIPAGTYTSDVELRPAPYTIVISQDATINITTVNIQQGGIHPKTGTKFLGKLTINLGDTNAYAWQRAHVRIGEYDSGAGDSDIFIEDVTLLGGHIDCNGVFITGDSFNIEFGNIKIPDNAKIGRGFLAHWGGASGLTYDVATNTVTWDGVTYTKHPHNITVNAMDVGILSAYDSAPAFDKAAVFISASYNIAIKNITVARAGYGYVATGGDYGFVYCGNTQLQLTKQKGLTLENATFQLTRARGISLSARTTNDINGQFYIPSENVNCSLSIRNVTTLGERLNATNGSHQLYMQDVSDVVLDNVSVSGAALKGVWLNGQCQRVRGNVTVTNCNHTSLAVTGSVSATAKDINIDLVSSNENRLDSSDPGLGSAVWMSGCERVTITGRCGNTTSPSNYVHGAQFGSTCTDCEVVMRIGDPSATYGGKCVNGDSFAFSARNRCDRSIILKYGSIAGNFISYDSSGHRVITGSTFPASGAWLKGDTCWNTENIVSGASIGWRVDASGVWKSLGLIP